MPTELVFYQALQSQGYIQVHEFDTPSQMGVEQERAEIEVLQKTLDYAEVHQQEGSVTIESILEKKKERFRYLMALYEQTSAIEAVFADERKLGDDLGFTPQETEHIAQYLVNERLAQVVEFGTICITHQGILEVERALTNPEQPTQYFPPVINIMHAQQIIGSQIQQGTQQSTLSGILSGTESEDLRSMIRAFKNEMANLQLDENSRAEAEAELKTLEAQANSPNPKRGIITMAATALIDLLKRIGPDALQIAIKVGIERLISGGVGTS